MIPKSTVTARFGPAQQAKGQRHLQLDDLVEARNVRQVKEFEYRKRRGYARLAPTVDAGSFDASAESLVSDGKRLITRDGTDEFWSYDIAANQYKSKGVAKRAYPEVTPARAVITSARKTTMVLAGGNYWIFTMKDGGYEYYLVDQATRTVTRTPTAVTATAITHYAVFQDGTSVWVIWTDNTTNLRAHELTIASPGTAPGVTVVMTITGTASGCDAVSIGGNFQVVVTSNNGTGFLKRCRFDTATGQAAVSPAAVEGSLGASSSTSPPSILVPEAAGAGAQMYVAFWNSEATTAHHLRVHQIATSTLALINNFDLDTETLAADSAVASWACGYVQLESSNDFVVFASLDTYTGGFDLVRPWKLTRYTEVSGVTELLIRPYSYPVSKPVKVGSTWYLVTGYDDFQSIPAARDDGVYKCFFLIDSDGKIVSQFLQGQGCLAPLENKLGNTLNDQRGFVSSPVVNGNRIDVAILHDVGGGGDTGIIIPPPPDNDHAPALVSIDLAASWGPPVRYKDGSVCYPGAPPVRVGASDNIRELVPIFGPPPCTFALGGGAAQAGPSGIQAVYALIDTDGTIYRSPPSAAQSVTFNTTGDRQVIVKNLTHQITSAQTDVQIELYATAVSGTEPFLVAIAANDNMALTTTFTFEPSSVGSAETIYTHGGNLANSPAPPTRAVAYWRDRLHLASYRTHWPSQEIEEGFGPRFNVTLNTVPWNDGEGDIRALHPCSHDYLGLWKTNAVGSIFGPGPDGVGSGGHFQVQTANTEKGLPLASIRSILKGPAAAYYQTVDARIIRFDGQAVEEVHQGAEDHLVGRFVSATLWDESQRLLEFFLDDGTIMVLDYAHPTAEHPAGAWYKWTSANLLRGYGAAIAPDGTAYHIETSGVLKKPQNALWTDAASGSTTPVLEYIKTSKFQPFGMNGHGDIAWLNFLGQFIGAHTLRITPTSGAVTDAHSLAVTAGGAFHMQPAGFFRVREVQVEIEETVNGGGTEGFIFDGLTLVVQVRPGAWFPETAERM